MDRKLAGQGLIIAYSQSMILIEYLINHILGKFNQGKTMFRL